MEKRSNDGASLETETELIRFRQRHPEATGTIGRHRDMTLTAKDIRWNARHGLRDLPSLRIDSYSLELHDDGELIGDGASHTAFVAMLDEWRERLHAAGRDPFGEAPSDELSKARIDRAASSGQSPAADTVRLAVEDFSQRVAAVASTFLGQPEWQGVERIVIGGGFKQTEVGRQTIARVQRLLHETSGEREPVQLTALHHDADDGGLIGWAHLAPPELLGGHDAILAIDIGGTNVRCGIVQLMPEVKKLRVVDRKKWRHSEDAAEGRDLVEGIVEMLQALIEKAQARGLKLAPFIGVACPGIIEPDGSISRGAQNLPASWQHGSFHLPRRLQENLPTIAGEPTVVLMHNDAVVQGLSELPFIEAPCRWAVLTIGTGLGNASFTSHG
ncbi:MAG: glucokinase [Rhizobacter sp.]|nr:glucokinase [Rhizobacter sp.]